MRDLDERINQFVMLSYQVTNKKSSKGISNQIKQIKRQRDRIMATRIRREAGLN